MLFVEAPQEDTVVWPMWAPLIQQAAVVSQMMLRTDGYPKARVSA